MRGPAPGVVGRASLSSEPLGGSGCLLVSSVVGPAVGACRQGLSMSVGGVDGVTRTGLLVLVAAMWGRGPTGARRTRVGSRRIRWRWIGTACGWCTSLGLSPRRVPGWRAVLWRAGVRLGGRAMRMCRGWSLTRISWKRPLASTLAGFFAAPASFCVGWGESRVWFVSEPFGGCCGQRARTLRAAGGECAPHPDSRSCSSRAGVGTRSSPRSASAAPTQNHPPPQRPAVREFHVKIIVTGGRDYQDLVTVRKVLSEYHQEPRPILVHGGARGADRIAAYVARELGWHVVAYPADWRRHGRAA